MADQSIQPKVKVAYQTRIGDQIQCGICPRACTLDEGGIGSCGGRQVIDGTLISINYAEICALHLDPIEKKPLYHFFPGSEILSVGPNGCNLTCPWCQNWQISQDRHATRIVLPAELADMVDALDGIGVAYTYAEPLIWFEYVRDAGRIFKERGLMNVFVTNGYINPDPLKEILLIADAFNVDLKSIDNDDLLHYCGAKLADVQRNIRMIYDAGKHLEITHLMVTDLNDDLRKVESLVKWIASVDRAIPLHLTRFHPAHIYEHQPTDTGFLVEAYELAHSYLDYVYLGNLHSPVGQDTLCKSCGATLVKRRNYRVDLSGLNHDRCQHCGAMADIRFDVEPSSRQICEPGK